MTAGVAPAAAAVQEEVLDASGNPVLDANGNPTYRTVDEVTTETVTHQTNPVERG